MAETKRLTVPAVEEILGESFPCLDKGFVRFVDYMGGDSAIVQAARVSYGDGTKTVREDKGLIDYLWRNKHTSPFEHVITKWHAKMPIFVARQWIRHRTARINEVSGRYSVMKDEFYVPPIEEVRSQSSNNKQARGTELSRDVQQQVLDSLIQEQIDDSNAYQERLDLGVAKETARINLPLTTYTEWYWNIDLHNLFHFLNLRMHPHAQQEIRVYADKIFDLTRRLVPFACESFERHTLKGLSLSSEDIPAISRVVHGEDLHFVAKQVYQDKFSRKEFVEKAKRFLS